MQAPLIVILSFIFMWFSIGPAALAGIAVAVVIVPLIGFLLVRHSRLIQVRKKKTDMHKDIQIPVLISAQKATMISTALLHYLYYSCVLFKKLNKAEKK